jgi:hypothetical protein
MKSKGGSLYEVLKSASRPSGQDPGAPSVPDTTPVADGNQATLQERLSAYKAAKLAAATEPSPEAPASAVTTTRVSATTLVLDPDPTPLPAPTVIRAEAPVSVAPASTRVDAETVVAPSEGPGERVFKLTYNSALFGGMVAVGLMFIAYAVGLHVGKGSAAREVVVDAPRPAVPIAAPVASPKPPPAPVVGPPVVKKEYTIRLCEMKISTSQERLKALAFAEDAELKRALERAGRKGYEKVTINRGGEPKMALYVDKFTDINSDAAKSALTAMKTFRWKNGTPFAQAVFEEAQNR